MVVKLWIRRVHKIDVVLANKTNKDPCWLSWTLQGPFFVGFLGASYLISIFLYLD